MSGTLRFARADLTHGPVTWFWACGDAWGTLTQAPAGDDGVRVGVAVRGGRLRLTTVAIDGLGAARLPGRRFSPGEIADATIGGRQMS